MMSSLDRIIDESNKAIHSTMGDQSIIEWAEDNVVLGPAHGQSGPINLAGSRYLHEPLLSIQDTEIKEITILKPTQTGGTLIAEIGIQWAMVNRPGNFHWLCETQPKAEEQMIDRLKPLFILNKSIAPLLPNDERKIRKNGIDLPSCIVKVTGNALSNLQSATRHLIIVDELAYYDDSTILYEIKSRTGYTSEKGNSKIIIVSQAGYPGNELDVAYKNGTQEEWMVPCERCNKYILPDITMFDASGKSFNDPELGLKDEKNNYILGKLEDVLTFTCPYCSHHMRDSAKLKAYWNENGKYIAQNPNPLSGHRSFHWSAVHCTKWIDLISNWLKVCRLRKNGNSDEFIKFLQKRMAKPYDPADYFDDSKVIKTEKQYNIESKWDKEYVTIMSVDVQQDKFYSVIRSWAKIGESRMLWAGWLQNIDQVIAKQKEYGVSVRSDKYGKNIMNCVVWDSGNPMRLHEVYNYCVQHKHLAIKGDTSGTKQFDHFVLLKNGKKINKPRCWALSPRRGDPNEGLAGAGKGPTCPLYILATDTLKRALVQLRDGKGPEWLVLPREIHPSWEDYNKGMFNEEFYLYDKRGKPIKNGIWKKINEDVTNESWDCEVYQIGAAVMCGVEIDLLNNLPSQEYLSAHTASANDGKNEDNGEK